MKILSIAIIVIFASANTAGEFEPERYFTYFLDGEGVPHLVNLEEKQEPGTRQVAQVDLNTVTFNLFTRNNPANAQTLLLNGTSSLINSNFQNDRPTRFVSHGWRASISSPACWLLRDAYLEAGDYNVIVVDWSRIAGLTYVVASKNVKNVAGHVAEFLNFLNQQASLNFESTQLVGHSLGGHLVSLAARFSSGTAQGVIALDPAGPGFENASVGNRVDSTDAANVQVIHTNAGLLGLRKNVGDSDFFLNSGKNQPGCGIDLTGTCAHSRAYLIFAESIMNLYGFRANEDRAVFLGGDMLTTARGKFTVKTAPNPPFALG